MFFETFLLKCLDSIDILRTFALAFAQKRARAQKESSLKDLHRQK
jgi:hypothetical protein